MPQSSRVPIHLGYVINHRGNSIGHPPDGFCATLWAHHDKGATRGPVGALRVPDYFILHPFAEAPLRFEGRVKGVELNFKHIDQW